MLSSQLALPFPLHAQGGHPTPSPVPSGVKEIKCHGRPIPQLEDITAKTGIKFEHLLAPEQKYILESMSGGVLLLDFDRDGWVTSETRKVDPAKYGSGYGHHSKSEAK